MDEFKKRLLIEGFNLTESVIRFKVFMNSDKFKNMDKTYKMSCFEQLNCMNAYLDKLFTRIKILIPKDDFMEYNKSPEFDFSTAIRLLKEGRKVSRRIWWDKDTYISKEDSIIMRSSDGYTHYSPSSSDMDALDWYEHKNK